MKLTDKDVDTIMGIILDHSAEIRNNDLDRIKLDLLRKHGENKNPFEDFRDSKEGAERFIPVLWETCDKLNKTMDESGKDIKGSGIARSLLLNDIRILLKQIKLHSGIEE
jgi:hypothetical protein